MASFGELLRQHRLAKGISQETLAEHARMSASAIGALERGSRRAPYRESVALLADALGLSTAARTEFEAAANRGRGRSPRMLSEVPRETWFVDLSPLANGAFAASAVGELLDISIDDSADAVASLAIRLKTRNMLLTLDNCEHVIDDAAALARALLHTCPNIAILATSREHLALEGEHRRQARILRQPPQRAET